MLVIPLLLITFVAGIVCGGWWMMAYLARVDEDGTA